MTIKEAVKYSRGRLRYATRSTAVDVTVLKIMIDATEKQIAIKPNKTSCSEASHYKCSICGKIFKTVYVDGLQKGYLPSYCEDCGQKIDRSEYR